MPPPATYTLSLHDALPISSTRCSVKCARRGTCSRKERQRSGFAITHRPTQTGRSFGRHQDVTTSHRMCLPARTWRSEEHTSELQSLRHLVCRLLLEKKKKR